VAKLPVPGGRLKGQNLTPLPTSARTSTSCRVFRKEEASPLARGEFARHGAPGEVNEVLGCLEDANDTDPFFPGNNCDLGAVGTESCACNYAMVVISPPSTRKAAPLVAEDSGLAR
jgi:hypothetical protein